MLCSSQLYPTLPQYFLLPFPIFLFFALFSSLFFHFFFNFAHIFFLMVFLNFFLLSHSIFLQVLSWYSLFFSVLQCIFTHPHIYKQHQNQSQNIFFLFMKQIKILCKLCVGGQTWYFFLSKNIKDF
jgi:hypothetical protein